MIRVAFTSHTLVPLRHDGFYYSYFQNKYLTSTRPRITKIECGSEHAKGERAYTERHVEPFTKTETGEPAVRLGLRALACWSWWYLE